jgi:phosphoglycerate dehydrogenase-like enzyme
VRVLVTFPGLTPEHLARIEAAAPGVEVAVEAYLEETARRSARGRGMGSSKPAPELTDAQRHAFAAAEVILSWDLPVEMGALAPDLRWVQAISAGVDHYGDCRWSGVTVTTAAGVAAGPIAEFVMARMLAEWKRLDVIADQQRRHEWRSAFGRVVEGRTLVVVGLGAIGTAVADRASAFGMEVLAVRRRADRPKPASVGEVHGPEQLHDVLGRADAVVVCAAATDETRGLFGVEAFAAMRPGAWFANVARGSLVDEDALVEALGSGQVAAAALDVVRTEPLPDDSALWDVPNLHISPHSAAAPERYVELLVELFVDNIGRHDRGDPLHNEVDAT